MSILEEIFTYKRVEVARQKQVRPLSLVRAEAEAAPQAPDFLASLVNRDHSTPALIAEVKRQSPSRGILVQDFDPIRLARIYRENGAAAVSVLTDTRYFGGSLEDLLRVSASMRSGGSLQPAPVLRKDFIFDPYQLYEARAAGAAAALLISAALSPALLNDLHALAGELGLAALVEVHQEDELEAAFSCRPRLVGINNRDLHTFKVNLSATLRLLPQLPAGTLVVAESGIHTAGDVACLAAAGVDAILVGEAIVSAPDPAGKVRELAGPRSHSSS